MEPDKPEECCVWSRKCESGAKNGWVLCHDGAAKFLLQQVWSFSLHSIMRVMEDLQIVLLSSNGLACGRYSWCTASWECTKTVNISTTLLCACLPFCVLVGDKCCYCDGCTLVASSYPQLRDTLPVIMVFRKLGLLFVKSSMPCSSILWQIWWVLLSSLTGWLWGLCWQEKIHAIIWRLPTSSHRRTSPSLNLYLQEKLKSNAF